MTLKASGFLTMIEVKVLDDENSTAYEVSLVDLHFLQDKRAYNVVQKMDWKDYCMDEAA